MQNESYAPTPDEVERMRSLRSKKSPLLTPYLISLYEGTADGRTPDQKSSIAQMAEALGVSYAAVYQRLAEHIKGDA